MLFHFVYDNHLLTFVLRNEREDLDAGEAVKSLHFAVGEGG